MPTMSTALSEQQGRRLGAKALGRARPPLQRAPLSPPSLAEVHRRLQAALTSGPESWPPSASVCTADDTVLDCMVMRESMQSILDKQREVDEDALIAHMKQKQSERHLWHSSNPELMGALQVASVQSGIEQAVLIDALRDADERAAALASELGWTQHQLEASGAREYQHRESNGELLGVNGHLHAQVPARTQVAIDSLTQLQQLRNALRTAHVAAAPEPIHQERDSLRSTLAGAGSQMGFVFSAWMMARLRHAILCSTAMALQAALREWASNVARIRQASIQDSRRPEPRKAEGLPRKADGGRQMAAGISVHSFAPVVAAPAAAVSHSFAPVAATAGSFPGSLPGSLARRTDAAQVEERRSTAAPMAFTAAPMAFTPITISASRLPSSVPSPAPTMLSCVAPRDYEISASTSPGGSAVLTPREHPSGTSTPSWLRRASLLLESADSPLSHRVAGDHRSAQEAAEEVAAAREAAGASGVTAAGGVVAGAAAGVVAGAAWPLGSRCAQPSAQVPLAYADAPPVVIQCTSSSVSSVVGSCSASQSCGHRRRNPAHPPDGSPTLEPPPRLSAGAPPLLPRLSFSPPQLPPAAHISPPQLPPPAHSSPPQLPPPAHSSPPLSMPAGATPITRPAAARAAAARVAAAAALARSAAGESPKVGTESVRGSVAAAELVMGGDVLADPLAGHGMSTGALPVPLLSSPPVCSVNSSRSGMRDGSPSYESPAANSLVKRAERRDLRTATGATVANTTAAHSAVTPLNAARAPASSTSPNAILTVPTGRLPSEQEALKHLERARRTINSCMLAATRSIGAVHYSGTCTSTESLMPSLPLDRGRHQHGGHAVEEAGQHRHHTRADYVFGSASPQRGPLSHPNHEG